ncbi:hypothetical protein [Aureimonas ureilytica]|uniref:hypothetical protein n=1 Tax=Aureimonas ureilytica TaxID=401562 RepID=UPI000B2AF400|nr:hypothetical protein [Aureimonas ureilytica]
MSRVQRVADWARRNLGKTLLAAATAGIGVGWTGFAQLEQSRATRFEERMLAEYQKVAASEQSVAINLEKLTFKIASGKRPEETTVRELNSDLVRMYVTLNDFKLGLNPEDSKKISDYQLALTNLKSEILRTKKLADLQYLASRFADSQRAFAEAKPVIEQRIGISLLKSS